VRVLRGEFVQERFSGEALLTGFGYESATPQYRCCWGQVVVVGATEVRGNGEEHTQEGVNADVLVSAVWRPSKSAILA